jgi:hypothetical protein
MSNYEKIYWLTRLDAIGKFCGIIVIIGSVLMGGRAVYKWFTFMEDDDLKLKPLKWHIYLFFWSIYISATLGLVFIPTQQEAVVIFAGGKTIDFIEADSSIKNIPHQTTELISKFMENEILEMNKQLESKKE